MGDEATSGVNIAALRTLGFCKFNAANVPFNVAAERFDDADVFAASTIVAEGHIVRNEARATNNVAALRKLLWTEHLRAVGTDLVPTNFAAERIDVADVVAALGAVAAGR